MRRSTALAVGVALTLTLAVLAALLVFATEHLHPGLLLIVVVLFQLSFMWTCAAYIDGPDKP
jgi:hypothetical protein